ncbi:TRAF family member-associated NF-kappa-B activator-like [Polyodon spathula]|uniref:TRAF family member-associated NF-kappa-B activator-like n=1 Tax=Polyodon spathula TaxID=7913 RepID=UPI001B7DCA8E|nr:TRAF family member-associated NF-kappa-B activator-like [Polyodon spathula]XP_041120732.1 TRAF family member-associated NF-kappa-B activator-like [Polyodon spathula]XP_041120734.1 TRAF family member-associated NF-kappa-B activator-like [Polyodon spathula]
MERKMGDQLNKAYEAYRQACIEKESAKKELLQKTEAYERHISELKLQLEEQNKLIAELRAQQSSAGSSSRGNVKGSENILEGKEAVLQTHRKNECQSLLAYGQLHKNQAVTSHSENLAMANLNIAESAQRKSVPYPGSGIAIDERKEVIEAFNEIRGTLQIIRNTTRKQKDHLNKLRIKNEAANEGQFSMPIQCTDVTVEQGALKPTKKTNDNKEVSSASITSRGVSPEDEDCLDSFSNLSVKFPPADTEYDFLNSAPEKPVALSTGRTFTAFTKDSDEVTQPEHAPNCRRIDWDRQAPGSDINHSNMAKPLASSTTLDTFPPETVRGPQQPFWSPHNSEDCADPEQNANPSRCEFCQAILPAGIASNRDEFLRHLNSHFKDPASNGS